MKSLANQILTKSKAIDCSRYVTWVLCIIGICCASAMQAHGVRPRVSAPALRVTRASNARPAKLPPSKTQVSASPSNAVATPAKVVLKNGILTVEANNSDLVQILKQIADVSGMTIDGSISSVRVYGVYGPSNSRNVLTDLLQGLGYNFMMVGVTPNGAPRELTLTPRTGGVTPAPPPAATSAALHSATSNEEEEPGRGAILHVPPAPPEDPQERMEQHLQHLQQMHNPMSQSEPQ